MKRKLLTALLAIVTTIQASERVEFKYKGLNISAPKKHEKAIKEKLLPALELKSIRKRSEFYFNKAASELLKHYDANSESMAKVWYKYFSLTKSKQEGLSACTKATPKLIDILEVYKKCGKNLSRIEIWVPGAYMNKPNTSKVIFVDRIPKYDWSFEDQLTSKDSPPELTLPLLFRADMDNPFNSGFKANYNYQLLQFLEQATDSISNFEQQLSIQFFTAAFGQLLSEKKISLEDKNLEQVLALTGCMMSLNKLIGKSFIGESIGKVTKFKSQGEPVTAQEFKLLCDLVSFTNQPLKRLDVTEKQALILKSIKHDHMFYTLFNILNYGERSKFSTLLETLKSLPQPVKSEEFVTTVNQIYQIDLEKELESITQLRYQMYARPYNRKRGIFTADDPIKVQPRKKYTILDGKACVEAPELTDELWKEVTTSVSDYIVKVENFIKVMDNYPTLDQEEINKKIEDIITISVDASAEDLIDNLFDFIKRYIKNNLYDKSGQINVQFYFWDDMIKRAKAGQYFPYMEYDKKENRLAANFRFGYYENKGETSFEEHPNIPFYISVMDTKEGRKTQNSTLFLDKAKKHFLNNKKGLFLKAHELTEATIVKKIIDIRKQTKCRWFHDGLAEFVAMKISPEGEREAYGGEDELKLWKDAKDVKLYDWPAAAYANEFDEKNNVSAYYYFSMQVFITIEKELGEAFIPKWMTEIRKTPYEKTTMKTIDNAFKKLSGKDLPMYANTVVKNFINKSIQK